MASGNIYLLKIGAIDSVEPDSAEAVHYTSNVWIILLIYMYMVLVS